MITVRRAVAAVSLSALLIGGGYLAILVGTGQYLEDRCLTQPFTSGWAPAEFEIIRGPIREGLISYRCESVADPRQHLVFTDPLPTLGAVWIVHATVGLVVLAWVAPLPGGAQPPRA